MKSPNLIPQLIIILACVATRAPQLLSPHLLLDGDESIIALMAKHLYEGKDVALYFWGQQYGLSILEILTIAAFYGILGVSQLAVKAAMLFLFTAGTLFLFRAFRNISREPQFALFLTLLFVTAPSWAVWSMKARGGYLTAFLLSSVALSIVTHPRLSYKTLTWVGGALLLVLVFESQPVFLAATLPVIVYLAWGKLARGQLAIFILSGLIIASLFRILHFGLSDFYKPTPFDTDVPILSNLTTLPSYLFSHYTGFYYLDHSFPAPVLVLAMAAAYSILTLALFVVPMHAAAKGYKLHGIFWAALCGIALMFCYSTIRSGNSYRYLLPITGSVLLAVAALPIPAFYKAFRLGALSLTTLGACALLFFYQYTFQSSSKKQLDSAISYLRRHRVSYCYSGPLLQWQLMFYSREELVCRFIFPTDRYPAYARQTDSAFEASPQHVALINAAEVMNNLSPADSFVIYEGFAIKLYPTKDLLKRHLYMFP